MRHRNGRSRTSRMLAVLHQNKQPRDLSEVQLLPLGLGVLCQGVLGHRLLEASSLRASRCSWSPVRAWARWRPSEPCGHQRRPAPTCGHPDPRGTTSSSRAHFRMKAGKVKPIRDQSKCLHLTSHSEGGLPWSIDSAPIYFVIFCAQGLCGSQCWVASVEGCTRTAVS